MEYTILEERHLADLATQVRLHVKTGWIPQGGVSVSITDNRTYGTAYCQAMVRTHRPPTASRSQEPKEGGAA